MEDRREQIARDWTESQWKPDYRLSPPLWLLRLLGGRLGRQPNDAPQRPQSAVSDGDEDSEDHICRGENLQPATPPMAC